MTASRPSPASPAEPRPPDPQSGTRRPSIGSTSPNAKSDQDSQRVKKKARAMNMNQSIQSEDVTIEDATDTDDIPVSREATEIPEYVMHDPYEAENLWNQASKKLFDRTDDWKLSIYLFLFRLRSM
ncbi:hypothetical protein LINGRAHAP2_LOCUS14964 [Linum grandiflorum]